MMVCSPPVAEFSTASTVKSISERLGKFESGVTVIIVLAAFIEAVNGISTPKFFKVIKEATFASVIMVPSRNNFV